MLILTQYIAKHEFKPLSRFLGINNLLEGAKKVIKGLAIKIKSPNNAKTLRFFKVRIGKKDNARMVVFLIAENQTIIPVLIRLKKDKIFGMNMAMNNLVVVQQINKNLDRVLEDIKSKQYQKFALGD